MRDGSQWYPGADQGIACRQLYGAVIAAALCLASVGPIFAGEAVRSSAPRAAPAERWRNQQLLIPAAAGKVEMITPVLLPSGPGPHPLAVVNHGTTENDELRADYAEPSFEIASGWLLAHGYAVAMPQRPGTARPAALIWNQRTDARTPDSSRRAMPRPTASRPPSVTCWRSLS